MYGIPNNRSPMSKAYVYQLWFAGSGYFYIGSTSDFEKRLDRHLKELIKGIHHNVLLQNAWDTGDQEISSNVLEVSNRELAYQIEEEWIKKAINGDRKHLLTNIGVNARAGDNLTRHPNKQEIVSRRVETQKTVFKSMSFEDRKRKYGRSGELNGMYGKNHTEEVRKLLSEKFKGHSFNKGCKLSVQHVEKIRARQKLRVGEKNSFYGKNHTEETKRKLRERMLGSIPTNVRSVSAENMVFRSCADVARFFNISQGLVTYRIRSEKYPAWFYLNAASSD